MRLIDSHRIDTFEELRINTILTTAKLHPKVSYLQANQKTYYQIGKVKALLEDIPSPPSPATISLNLHNYDRGGVGGKSMMFSASFHIDLNGGEA